MGLSVMKKKNNNEPIVDDNPAVIPKAVNPVVMDGSVKNQAMAPTFAANKPAFKT